MFNLKKKSNLEKIRQVFSVIDKDRDNKLDKEELMKFFRFNKKQQELMSEIMSDVDINCDGFLTFEEFYESLTRVDN